MSRIRTIKPSFFLSMKVQAVPRDARLLFIGLLTEADDEGRLVDSPKRLAGVLFPGDDDISAKEVHLMLATLAGAGLIIRYEAEGGAFIQVEGFNKHQRINRKSPSSLPSPPLTADAVRPHCAISEASASRPRMLTDGSVRPHPQRNEEVHRELELELEKEEEEEEETEAREPDHVTRMADRSSRFGVLPRMPRAKRPHPEKPKTIQELLASPLGQRLAVQLQHLDGRRGRPSLEAVIGTFWRNFETWRWPDEAQSKLETYLAKEGRAHRAAWEREGNLDIEAMTRRPGSPRAPPPDPGEHPPNALPPGAPVEDPWDAQ